MSININHTSGKISTSDKDLKLDAEGLDNNISAQTNRIVNVVDPGNQTSISRRRKRCRLSRTFRNY
jgi:hypothetical protein